MKNTAPRKTPLRVPAILSGIALAFMLTACTTTMPAAYTQNTTQTTQAAEATGVAEVEGAAEATDVAEPAEEPGTAVQTAFPDLEAPDGEPELDSITDARPTVGEVVQAAGPFDQRFVLDDLTFDGSSVSGKITITSDISTLLALQVIAGFYDEQGNLLGTNRFDHEPESEHTHGGLPEPETFDITVPAEFADRAASAAVAIPILVNE